MRELFLSVKSERLVSKNRDSRPRVDMGPEDHARLGGMAELSGPWAPHRPL